MEWCSFQVRIGEVRLLRQPIIGFVLLWTRHVESIEHGVATSRLPDPTVLHYQMLELPKFAYLVAP